ncbi:putative C6 transcription factor [Halenospora varia]|nr:putative C6 transcription factor [Halenospora varia]
MIRGDRLPTRVSKACNRCKKHKQRCDLERPCRHCVHAQEECTTDTLPVAKKPRLRKDNTSVSTPAPTEWRAPAPHSQAPERQSVSTPRTNASSHDEFEHGEARWNTPKASVAGSHDTQPSPQTQLKRGSSDLPEFDADSALAITRKIFRFQESPAFKDRATFAIPGGEIRHTNGTNSSNNPSAPLIPVSEIIGIELPTYEVCNKLLEVYFSTVHWFSLVVYEPKFRARYNAIVGSGLASRSDHGFLLLLLIVLIMGCWYTPKNRTGDLGLTANDMEALRSEMLKVVQRDFMDLMDEDRLEFVQLCALLGSFYLYHGRPRSSFSILGAATKTAQAMELHRDSEARLSFEDSEERKRVWWTMYTWDRFATITYGRPFGINDKDCNVTMPSEITENIHFDPLLQATQVCLSTYQYRLNLVYRIASPLLEDIYGMRSSHDTEGSGLPEMVATANQALLEWQNDLPAHLVFDQLNDLTAYSTAEEKMHSLQAMSLQLTYDNLMIVLHRPMLARRGYGRAGVQAMSPPSHFSDDMQEASFKRCLRSALRISNLQRKQNIFALARTTHLVAFLGMNLFTASVVLFICALSDTLSDTAQEAKRGMRRTLQMQKALSNYASLSMQCSTILEDLVQLILKKELEEMLQDHGTGEENTFNRPENGQQQLQNRHIQGEVPPNERGLQPQTYTAGLGTGLEGDHNLEALISSKV